MAASGSEPGGRKQDKIQLKINAISGNIHFIEANMGKACAYCGALNKQKAISGITHHK